MDRNPDIAKEQSQGRGGCVYASSSNTITSIDAVVPLVHNTWRVERQHALVFREAGTHVAVLSFECSFSGLPSGVPIQLTVT